MAASLAAVAAFGRAHFEERLAASRHTAQQLADESRQLAMSAGRAEGPMAAAEGAADSSPAVSRRPTVQRLLQDLQRAAAARGVVLVSTTASGLPGLQTPPAQTELALTLTGRYSPLLATMGELLDRNRAVVLQHLMITRSPSASELEARATLMLPSAPQASVSGASLPAR